jgi:phage terminase large subunit
MLKHELQPIILNINESRLELKVRSLKGESTISLRGWEAIETLRGQAFDMLVIDEVASMRNFWVGWQEVLRATLTDSKGDVIFISTPKGFNHFYTLFEKEKTDTDYKSFHFTSYDNPYISKDEVDKAKIELDENQFAQEYMADFRKVEGLVYNLTDDLIIEPIDVNWKTEARIMGIDWGYRNPAALSILYLKDKVWYLTDEWKLSGRTTAEIIQVIKNKLKEHQISNTYPDPAEPDRLEECRRAGIPVMEANKDIKAGVSMIQNLIREKRLRVCKNCTYTIEEFNTYQYPEGIDGKPLKDVPDKLNDHLMDSIRYALYSYGGNVITYSGASGSLNKFYPEIGI